MATVTNLIEQKSAKKVLLQAWLYNIVSERWTSNTVITERAVLGREGIPTGMNAQFLKLTHQLQMV